VTLSHPIPTVPKVGRYLMHDTKPHVRDFAQIAHRSLEITRMARADGRFSPATRSTSMLAFEIDNAIRGGSKSRSFNAVVKLI